MDVDSFPSPSPSSLNADTSAVQRQHSGISTSHSCSPEDNYLSIPAPKKRPRPQDDPFFQEGNFEYKAAWLRLEDEEAYISNPADDPTTVKANITEESHSERNWAPQVCQLGLCHGKQIFSTPIAYEHHYEIHHRHICHTCHKAFPGERWLRLHLNEIHDVLLRIRRERGEKTYQCFVDDCERFCSTPEKRKRHLIDKHKYPKHFNYDIVRTGVLPVAVRVKHAQREKALWASRERGRQKAHQDRPKLPNQNMTTFLDMDIDPNPASQQDTLQQQHRTAGLKEGQSSRAVKGKPLKSAFQQYRSATKEPPAVEKVSKAPLPESLHDSDTEQDHIVNRTQTETTQQQDMDIDQLQNSMAKLMIPRSVAARMRSTKG